jgi:hypothetical protein
VTKRRKVSADAKILISLKALAYGTSVNAFRDYFQMGESTACLCLIHFIYGVFKNEDYRSRYLRSMSPADARRVKAMHYQQHGIHGMAGSLDCSHVEWNNCPVAYQGQFKGKEERSTIIMEVACDYQLYAWHAVGSLSCSSSELELFTSQLLLGSSLQD